MNLSSVDRSKLSQLDFWRTSSIANVPLACECLNRLKISSGITGQGGKKRCHGPTQVMVNGNNGIVMAVP